MEKAIEEFIYTKTRRVIPLQRTERYRPWRVGTMSHSEERGKEGGERRGERRGRRERKNGIMRHGVGAIGI